MRLEVSEKQQQVLAPQLHQSVRILSMNAWELTRFISDAATENPLLEFQTEQAPHLPLLGKRVQREAAGVLGVDWLPERYLREERSLRGELMEQIPSGYPKMAQLRYLIENLDERGYISREVADKVSGDVLKVLQSMEPAGVGAVDLADCLIIQLEREKPVDALAIDIVKYHLEALAHGHMSYMMKELRVGRAALQESIAHIRRLRPIPANGYTDGSPQENYALPDAFVIRTETGYKVECPWGKRLSLNRDYDEICKSDINAGESAFIEEKRRDAEQLIRFVHQRRKTLERLTRYIVDAQREFFLNGSGDIALLSTKDLARSMDLHVSTVCRTIQGKYLYCEWGVFPYRFFLARSVNEEGTDSSASIKRVIKELIASESADKPLSDQTLVEILGKQGIILSRRAVAKYRDAMSIPSSYIRKNG
ncbi:MAG: RNA polymerase factor sigma-54, partial [Clostridia bacterium]|nr:RNA polymerase factor sigma-54 [Clostridia bacterium]